MDSKKSLKEIWDEELEKMRNLWKNEELEELKEIRESLDMLIKKISDNEIIKPEKK